MQITRLNTASDSTQKTTRPLNRRIKTIESTTSYAQSPDINLKQSLMSKQNIFSSNPFVFTQQTENSHSQMTFLHDTLTYHQQIIETNRVEQINNTNRLAQKQPQNQEISRMKLMLQSRLNNQKNNKNYQPNRSIDKSPNSRSIEKHTLKPTSIPNFSKLLEKTQQSKCQQSASSLQSPNFSHERKQKFSIQNLVNNKYQFQINGSQKIKVTDLSQKTENQSTQKRNILECSGISSKFAEYEFSSQIKERISMDQQSKRFQQQIQSPGYVCSLNLEESKKQTTLQENSQNKNHQCSCESLLKTFMEQTNNKMAQITERLMILENQNARLKKIESKFIQNSKIICQYEQQAEQMQKQCNQLKESNYSYQAEKEELQCLLKQILFKRQKEKYHQTSTSSTSSSKENTHRYEYDSKSRVKTLNQTNDKQQWSNNQYYEDQVQYDKKNNSAFKKDSNFIVKKGIEPLGVKTTNINPTQNQVKSDKKSQTFSDSKIKMQNLLSKIQIKIQKN